MKVLLVAVLAGVLFSIGLGVAGMTHPDKVIGFLDFARWDPSLMFVMGGVVLVDGVLFRLILRRPSPLWAPAFTLPGATGIDARLIARAMLFGVGWGISGFCPGPAITSAVIPTRETIAFVGAMFSGMAIHDGGRALWRRSVAGIPEPLPPEACG